MKREVLKMVKFCDACESEDSIYYECVSCGKNFCYNCKQKNSVGQEFRHAVHFSGSFDCFLCMDCLASPTPKTKEILAAYLKIQQLTEEEKSWYECFRKRCEDAETKVKVIADKYSIK